MSRTLTTVLLALLVALAGCGGGAAGGGDGAVAGGDGDEGAAGADGSNGADGGSGAAPDPDDRAATDDADTDLDTPEQPTRMRIRTGRITLAADSFDDVRATLTRTATDLGGYVSGGERETHREGNRTWTNGTLVLRVPNENFTPMMDAARDAGDVRTAATNSTDVADRIVNTEARLENLRKKRDRLRDLYDGASRTEELLSIQERISETQGEIERLTARKAALEDRVAYATITVHVEEPKPPAVEDTAENESDGSAWYETGPAAAFAASVDGIATALWIGGVAVAYALPYVLAVAVPAVAFVGLRRRRGTTRQ